MKKKHTPVKTINNKRARFDYDIKDEYVAGIVLTGAETKSLRFSRASLRGAFVTIKDSEAWLNNMQVMPMNTNHTHLEESEQTRARKLLLKEREIQELMHAKDQGKAIVPIKLLYTGRYIKVVIATGVGKKLHDKRAKIKERDTNRDIHRDLKK
jgi:SsrA-binding protein